MTDPNFDPIEGHESVPSKNSKKEKPSPKEFALMMAKEFGEGKNPGLNRDWMMQEIAKNICLQALIELLGDSPMSAVLKAWKWHEKLTVPVNWDQSTLDCLVQSREDFEESAEEVVNYMSENTDHVRSTLADPS